MHLDAVRQRVGRIQDHLVSGRQAGGDLHRTAEVVADGDRHKLDAITSDDTDAKALCAEQQRVRRNRYRVTNRWQLEVDKDVGSWAQHTLRVVDIHLDVEGACGVVDGVGVAYDGAGNLYTWIGVLGQGCAATVMDRV